MWQSYSFPLKKPFPKTVLVEFARWCFEAHRGLWWKWKYLPLKIGKNLSEKLLGVLLIHSQTYSFPLKKPFAKIVPVEMAKWYLEAHRGPWWKGKYLPLKTGKKLSEKLQCVLLIHLTELQLSPQEAFHYDCSCGICNVIFVSPYRAMAKKEISSVKNWKEAFWETAVCSVNSSQRIRAFPWKHLPLRLFLWNLQSDNWKPIDGYGEKGNILR